MKILHLIYTHGISGAEKYLKHLLPGLKAYGIHCELVVVCPKKASGILTRYCNELNDLGVKTTLLQTSRAEILFTAKKVNRYLKEHNIHILHAHLFNSDLIAALVKSFFYPGLYLISSKHGYQEKLLQQYEAGMQLRPNDLYYHITKYTLRKIDQNLAVSNGIAELFVNIGLAKTKYPYIHHGISVEAFDKEAYRDECKKADPQLIIVGRLELFKGHRFLIDALPDVIEAFPGTKLLVLGEGSEKDNCMQQVARLGLQNHVAFLGFKTHPYSYISHSDVIILPSLFEPFGLVYIEALALKVPVVAFNTPAANEIIENNETGLLVDKGDHKALAEKIIYLLSNPAERNNIAERAYAKYKSHFTTGVMIQKTAEWYLSLGR
ncbi:MAG: glycosyltransferase [Chitinophagaceae bacterium]|nr:glycosyltransferase [Chitinophagaceae bacterium]